MMTRDGIKDILKTSVANVTFTKSDGTERIMRCTLKEEFLPEMVSEDDQSEKKARKVNLDVLPVWDLDKKSWRSFRIDSLCKLEIELR